MTSWSRVIWRVAIFSADETFTATALTIYCRIEAMHFPEAAARVSPTSVTAKCDRSELPIHAGFRLLLASTTLSFWAKAAVEMQSAAKSSEIGNKRFIGSLR